MQHHVQTHGGDEDETHHEFPNDSVSSFPRCCASSALLQHREMIGERRDKRERTHKRRTKTQLLLSLSLSLSLLISPSYRLFSFSPSSSRQMMMMVQNCRGNNRTAPLFCFEGAGERLETFFSFWSVFFRCEANLTRNLSLLFHKVVFFKRLFRKAATSVPSRDILLFFRGLFSSNLFFSC